MVHSNVLIISPFLLSLHVPDCWFLSLYFCNQKQQHIETLYGHLVYLGSENKKILLKQIVNLQMTLEVEQSQFGDPHHFHHCFWCCFCQKIEKKKKN